MAEDIDILNIKVEGYHKRLHDLEANCDGRCSRYGERIGNIEKVDAVQDNIISSMNETVKEIQKTVTSLQIKVAGTTGIILIAFKVLELFIKSKGG
jgi:hypothetical protein